MVLRHRVVTLLLSAMVSGLACSAATARQWKPTPAQIASDYAQINHARGQTEFVNIRWWAPPTVASGTPFFRMIEKYVVISVVHFRTGTAGVPIVEDIDTLEVRDDSDNALTLVPRNELLPSELGMISTVEASLRQSTGRLGEGTKLFVFDAGAVRACEKGRLSIPYAGETYTWDTPLPGCNPSGQ